MEYQAINGSCTYQSPPESARAELGLVPAAADAKDAGAMEKMVCEWVPIEQRGDEVGG
jgi:hypothetical protein